jgi:hypothetical protein
MTGPDLALSLRPSAGSLGTYTLFAGVSLTAVLVVYGLVPELKGKTLEEVEVGCCQGDRVCSSVGWCVC